MRLLLALLLAAWAGAAPAQVVTDAAGLREIGARLLAQGEAGRARDLAGALLARDPGDVAALLLLARAALAEGDAPAALPAARRAHAEAPPGPARFLAARLAARAHAERGQDLRAQFWLRRSLSDVPSAEAARDVAADLRALRARSPLAVSLSFGIAPTSNVNGGSSSETILLPGLPFEFVLSGDAQALSGLRVSAGGTVSRRIARSARAETLVELQASGRTYVLSPEARDQAPDVEGSDFADVAASASLVHRWRGDRASGPSSVRLTYGQSWYNGEPYTQFVQLTFDRAFVLSDVDRLDLSLFRRWTDRRSRIDVGLTDPITGKALRDRDTGDRSTFPVIIYEGDESIGGQLRWTRLLGSGDRANISVELRNGLTELADVSYDGVTLGAGFDRRRLLAGLRVGAAAEIDWRRYGLSKYAVDGREDLEATLRLSAGVPRWSFLGFEPVVTLEAGRTWSDVSLYDRDALSIDLGFRSRI